MPTNVAAGLGGHIEQIADAPVSRVTGQFIYGNAVTPWLFPM